MRRIRSRLTYANVISTLALFLVLGGGTALASYVINSNSQVGPGTISGHKPPAGKHANLILGSIGGADLANGTVPFNKLKRGDGSTTVNVTNLAQGCTGANVPAPGAVVGQVAVASFIGDVAVPANLVVTARKVTAPDQVSVAICNVGPALIEVTGLGVRVITLG